MALALDKQTVSFFNEKTAKIETLPALHPNLVLKRDFIYYASPPEDKSQISFDEWKDIMNYLIEDLDWLLRLPHDKFWCQVAFDKTVKYSIKTFLSRAKRSYDILQSNDLTDEMTDLHRQVYRMYFLVCVRLSTYKENKEHFITPSEFGNILYSNQIFDIGSLIDMCAVFGSSNAPLLGKMINNIFINEPKFTAQLKQAVPVIEKTLVDIMKKFGAKLDDDSDINVSSPEKLRVIGVELESSLVTMNTEMFVQILAQLSDAIYSLKYFFDFYPPAMEFFFEQSFLARLVAIVEKLKPILQQVFFDRLTKNKDKDQDVMLSIRHKTSEALICAVKVFRLIIVRHCIEPVLENQSVEIMQSCLDQYLNILMTHSNDKIFLGFYNSLYPVEEDFDLYRQSQCVVDETSLQFVLGAVKDSSYLLIKVGNESKDLNTLNYNAAAAAAAEANYDSSIPMAFSSSVSANSSDDKMKFEDIGACAATKNLSDIEIQSLISNVRDLLPELGEGFIEMCLEEFNYELEPVINALLEDKLPASLKSVDKLMKTRSKVSVKDTSAKVTTQNQPASILESRRNVYQNDEFDVFSRNEVDMSRIYIGKRERESRNLLTEQEKEKQLVMSKKFQIAYVDEADIDKGDYWLEYDDEYDDTYDENMVGSADVDSADELANTRKFETPRVLGGRRTEEGRVEESSEEEEETPKRDEFVANPEKVREEQARRRAAKMGLGNVGYHREIKDYDVKGRGRGQGQSEDVLRNRAWKERNKGARVHHNRKDLSDKKRRF